MNFWEERAFKEYIEYETRVLSMPDDTSKIFTGLHIMWLSFDKLTEIYKKDPAWIIKLALEESEAKGAEYYPFEESFPNIVAYICQQYDQEFDPYYKA